MRFYLPRYQICRRRCRWSDGRSSVDFDEIPDDLRQPENGPQLTPADLLSFHSRIDGTSEVERAKNDCKL